MDEQELRLKLKETAHAIAELDENPSTWMNWLVILLRNLQDEAMTADPLYQDIYREMLVYLQGVIRTRLNTGGW